MKDGQNQSGEDANKKKLNCTCHLCGKVRHKKAKCWLKPENTHLHPAWFHVNGSQNGDKQGGARVDGGSDARSNNGRMELMIPAVDHCLDDHDDELEELSLVNVKMMASPQLFALLNDLNV